MSIKVQNEISKSIPTTFNIRLFALTLAALVTSACNQSNIKMQQENQKKAQIIAHDQYEKKNVKHALPVVQVAEFLM